MIDMEVGAEDEVDFLRRNASPLQFVEIAGGQSVEGRFRAAITAIAAAGVDQHGEARRAHQERVDADQQPPGRRLDEFGAEPRELLFDSLGRRVVDQPIAIESEARQLGDLLYRDGSKALRAHREALIATGARRYTSPSRRA